MILLFHVEIKHVIEHSIWPEAVFWEIYGMKSPLPEIIRLRDLLLIRLSLSGRFHHHAESIQYA
jgi:hypothetical protein